MVTAVVCRGCKRDIPVPEGQAGRWFMCPHCNETLFVPGPGDPPAADPDHGDARQPGPAEPAGADSFSPADRLGVAALFLGTVSILILCIPFLGYGALALTSAGLTLGLGGLFKARQDRPRSPRPRARRARRRGRPGEYPVNYPLIGILACLIALALELLPFLRYSGSD
jgi:hypothetical protein